MWVNKKKYNELIKQKEELDKIATNAVAQNGRLLDGWHATLEEMKGIQEYNRCLQQRNEELIDERDRLEAIARHAVSEKDEMIDECIEMKTQLDLAIKQRDYYYDLLENTSEVEEDKGED